MQGFPLEDLAPCLLVVAVMDGDDVTHVLLFHVPLLPVPTLQV